MKYTHEWKKKKKKWVEKHKHSNGEVYWSVHYMLNNVEYSNGEYASEKQAEENLKQYNL